MRLEHHAASRSASLHREYCVYRAFRAFRVYGVYRVHRLRCGARGRRPRSERPLDAVPGGAAARSKLYDFGRSARATAIAASIVAGTFGCPPAVPEVSWNLPSTMIVGTDWMLYACAICLARPTLPETPNDL